MKNVRTRSVAAAIAASLSLTAGMAAADDSGAYLKADLTAVHPEDRLGENESISFGGGVGVGYQLFDTLALELGAFTNPVHAKKGTGGTTQGVMLDVVQTIFPMGDIKPFVIVGGGLVTDKHGKNDNAEPAIEAGIGVNFLSIEGVKIRASAVAQDIFNNDIIQAQDSFVDYRFNLGFTAPFGSAEPAKAAKPVDSDGDGVADSADSCPNTAASTANGCPAPVAAAPVAPPKDTDGDGVMDNADACPGTLAGLKVDARGCVLASAQSIVLKGVTFNPSSAELTAEAKAVLDTAAASLAGQEGLKVEVGGHTDSLGNAAKNTALSQARADSVRSYLISKGVKAENLTAKGYGSSVAIADNKTKEGRAENRRVELKIVK